MQEQLQRLLNAPTEQERKYKDQLLSRLQQERNSVDLIQIDAKLEYLINKLSEAHIDQKDRLPKPIRQRVNLINVKLSEFHQRAGKRSKERSDKNIPRINKAIEIIQPFKNSVIKGTTHSEMYRKFLQSLEIKHSEKFWRLFQQKMIEMNVKNEVSRLTLPVNLNKIQIPIEIVQELFNENIIDEITQAIANARVESCSHRKESDFITKHKTKTSNDHSEFDTLTMQAPSKKEAQECLTLWYAVQKNISVIDDQTILIAIADGSCGQTSIVIPLLGVEVKVVSIDPSIPSGYALSIQNQTLLPYKIQDIQLILYPSQKDFQITQNKKIVYLSQNKNGFQKIILLMQHPHCDVADALKACEFGPISENKEIFVVVLPCCQDASRFAPIPPIKIYDFKNIQTPNSTLEIYKLTVHQAKIWADSGLGELR